ncbi:MAG: hypothetical protein N4A49_08275 [Marinifilaceae bacterium]|jgi:bleomycin hydrolase|nr:hypothetical protein [Marinifilaceae bacterium]
MRKITLTYALVFFALQIFAQNKDKSFFKEYSPGYYQNSILKDIRNVDAKLDKAENDKRFFMDQKGYDLPNKYDLYKNIFWANPTISQGNTGTCWCFSTTSFYESEVYRLHKKKVKISEMYTVYFEYIEKAKRYVQERGNSVFAEGAEGNSVARMWKKYGACPANEYTGLLNGRKFHTHAKMYKEMRNFLKSLKISNAWNEDFVVETIKSIMNKYMGVPPTEFVIDGKKYTPKTYLAEYLKLNPDDYVEILSYKQEPYWQKVEYKVPDNWWHSKEYYNIPLDDYMKLVKSAIRNGYTMSIGGDVSEAGFLRTTNCAMVPDFDIPSAYINEDARQFRFSNETTTDDHGMHMTGYYTDKNGKDWYLIKDSSSGSRNIDENSKEFGFYFFHEDYVKLKMMGFTIHKDAAKKILKKFK